MLSRLLRRWTPDLLRPLIALLLRVGVSANGLTLAGLLLAVLAGGLVAAQALTPAAWALLLSGVVDGIDGELARQGGQASNLGGFLDSIADHYGDFAVYLGLIVHALSVDNASLVLLTAIAMFGSLVGSQIRSRGAMLELDTKDIGWFTRAERVLVLVLALTTPLTTPLVALLAAATNVSALQRLVHITREARRRAR